MINEAYCSFEVSELLKEKGFNGECKAFYEPPRKRLCEIRWEPKPYISYNQYETTNHIILAPSLAMAMAWLREVHNQIIIIKYGNVGFVEESILQWWWELLNTKGELHACNIVDGNKSYEEACEAAIKYCLENLIS